MAPGTLDEAGLAEQRRQGNAILQVVEANTEASGIQKLVGEGMPVSVVADEPIGIESLGVHNVPRRNRGPDADSRHVRLLIVGQVRQRRRQTCRTRRPTVMVRSWTLLL